MIDYSPPAAIHFIPGTLAGRWAHFSTVTGRNEAPPIVIGESKFGDAHGNKIHALQIFDDFAFHAIGCYTVGFIDRQAQRDSCFCIFSKLRNVRICGKYGFSLW